MGGSFGVVIRVLYNRYVDLLRKWVIGGSNFWCMFVSGGCLCSLLFFIVGFELYVKRESVQYLH